MMRYLIVFIGIASMVTYAYGHSVTKSMTGYGCYKEYGSTNCIADWDAGFTESDIPTGSEIVGVVLRMVGNVSCDYVDKHEGILMGLVKDGNLCGNGNITVNNICDYGGWDETYGSPNTLTPWTSTGCSFTYDDVIDYFGSDWNQFGCDPENACYFSGVSAEVNVYYNPPGNAGDNRRIVAVD